MSFVGVRNRCWNTIDISNMIILIVSLFDLVYKLASSHVGTGEIVMKAFISSCVRFASYSNAWWHIYHPFYAAHI